MTRGPKILIVDIETAPILAYVWGLFDQNIALNQIVEDWNMLSWSARWYDDPPGKTIYADLRGKDPRNDKSLMKPLRKLLNEADIVVGQNSKKFDTKKINSRFRFHKMKPPSSYKHLDILEMNKRLFGETSNKLEYISNKHNTKFKKLTHKEFPGQELWNECMKSNPKAWKAMEEYNKHDVLATEEAFKEIMPWGNTINFALYAEGANPVCWCGGTSFTKADRYAYTSGGRYHKYHCDKCGNEMRSKENLFDKDKKKNLRMFIPR